MYNRKTTSSVQAGRQEEEEGGGWGQLKIMVFHYNTGHGLIKNKDVTTTIPKTQIGSSFTPAARSMMPVPQGQDKAMAVVLSVWLHHRRHENASASVRGWSACSDAASLVVMPLTLPQILKQREMHQALTSYSTTNKSRRWTADSSSSCNWADEAFDDDEDHDCIGSVKTTSDGTAILLSMPQN